MDWTTLSALISNDSDYPARANRIAALGHVLDGTQYDVLPFDFWTEEDSGGKYLEMDQRRPSVRTNLCRITVDECGSLLFSQGRFPRVLKDGDAEESDRMQELVNAAGLHEVMQEAVLQGSVGSVALLVQFMSDRVFVKVRKTTYLTPVFDPEEPDKLLAVTERYKISGRELQGISYISVPNDDTKYWWQCRWDAEAETIFQPEPVVKQAGAATAPAVASQVKHGLDFTPVIWIKNLPGGDGVDGGCTFRSAIDTVIELDYLESQGNRAMRYMGDPKLVIKGKMSAGQSMTASAANAITVGDAGDAKLLELQGGSAEAFDRRTKSMRRAAMEAMHGNLADPEKVSAATSGRAMELLHQPQIWQADRLRVSYGKGLLRLLAMIGEGAKYYNVLVEEKKLAPFTATGIRLAWGAWFDPTYGDIVAFTSGLQNAVDAAIISHETATKIAADVFEIADVAAERALIDQEMKAEYAQLLREKAMTQAKVTLPG